MLADDIDNNDNVYTINKDSLLFIMVWTHRKIMYNEPETKPSLNHIMHSFILPIGRSGLCNNWGLMAIILMIMQCGST